MKEVLPFSEIGKIVSPIKTWNPVRSNQIEPFLYIDLSSIDQKEKRIVVTSKILPKEAPSRARQLLREGDVLVSTVRPNLNGVAYVSLELDGATASTGFCVLRPKQGKLVGRYLYHWVQSPQFVEEMVKFATGANYPAVSDRIIKDSQIPLPLLEEQKRIAAILDKAAAIRRKRLQAIKFADDFLHALFLDMFGDPVINPKGWEVKKLKEISTNILSGTTPKGGKQVYVEEGVIFFRSQNVWRNRLLLDDVTYIDNETHLKMKKSSLKNKDILMTKTGRINTENSSLGRAAMFLGKNNSANINGHVYLIRLQKTIIHEYVLYILTTDEYREYIRRVCVGGIDKRQINKEHLEEFPIIFPPLDLQNRFATIVELVEQQKARLRGHLAELDILFASLTQHAFRGEL